MSFLQEGLLFVTSLHVLMYRP